MKIGISTFGGDGGKSGISRYIIQLLDQFARLTDKNSYEAFVYQSERQLFISDPSKIQPIGLSERLRSPVINILWHQLALPGWCRRRGYQVLFLPAGNRRLPWRLPCPSVGVVHDLSSLHVSGKYDRQRMFYIKTILPIFIRRLDHVVTISESSKKDIVEYAGVPESRVSVIPLGVDHHYYCPGNHQASAEKVAKDYRVRLPYILYISRIEHPGKNHLRLIAAFEMLKEKQHIPHSLVLVGSDWNRAEQVHAAVEKSRYVQDIFFSGFVADADLPDFYRGADVFVFPSLYEGFGLPVLEAMACATPVACSDISSLPEVAGNAALLFDPHQPEAIADSIRQIIFDHHLRQQIVDYGIQRSAQFTWASTAHQTLAIIEQIAGR